MIIRIAGLMIKVTRNTVYTDAVSVYFTDSD